MERQPAQLMLIDPDEASGDWQLDDHTRTVGQAGVAQAREALRDALRRKDAA